MRTRIILSVVLTVSFSVLFAQKTKLVIYQGINSEIRLKSSYNNLRMAAILDTLNSSYANLTGSYSDPSWITSLSGSKITGSISGTIPWSNITSTPTTLAGYGITDAGTINVTSGQIGFANGAHSIVSSNKFKWDDSSPKLTLWNSTNVNSLYIWMPNTTTSTINADGILNIVAGTSISIDPPNNGFTVPYLNSTGSKRYVYVDPGGTLKSQATPIPISDGGTALTTFTTGDLPYASASNVLSKLGIGSTGDYLKVSGGVPSWGPIPDAIADGSTKGVASYNSTYFDSSLGIITIDDTNGLASGSQAGYVGTGAQTFAGIKTLSSSPLIPTPSVGDNSTKGANTAFVAAAIAAASTLTHNYIPVGNSSNVAVGVPVSGDITINDIGVTTLSTDRWKLAGTSTPTADMTIGAAFNLTFSGLKQTAFNNTYTTTGDLQFMNSFGGIITGRSMANEQLGNVSIVGTVKSGIANQIGYGLYVKPTFDEASGSFQIKNIAAFLSTGSGQTLIASDAGIRTNAGLSFNTGSTAGNNKISFNNSVTGGLVNASGNTTIQFAFGTSNTVVQPFEQQVTLAPTTGSSAFFANTYSTTINETGTHTGGTTGTYLRTIPTAFLSTHTNLLIGSSAGITTAFPYIGIDYNPTVTSIATHYAALFRSGLVGIGTGTPTDNLDVPASTTSIGSFRIRSGSLSTGGNIRAGQITNVTDKLYYAISTGPAHKEFTLNDAALTSGTIPIATTNGRLTDWMNPTTGLLAGSGSISADAVLEAKSTTKGFRPPLMTTTQRDAISSPGDGLIISNSTSHTIDYYNGSTWNTLSTSAAWLLGSGGTATGNNTFAMGTNTLKFTSAALDALGGYEFSNTFTANANNLYAVRWDGSLTGSSTSGHNLVGASFGHAFVAGANNQSLSAMQITPAFSVNTVTGVNTVALTVNNTTSVTGGGSTNAVLALQVTGQSRMTGGLFLGSLSTSPTAVLHLTAGTTSTAPFRFTTGPLTTGGNILAGNVEFLTDKWYATISTGPTQKEFTLNDAALTSGTFPIATTNGRLTDSGFTSTNLTSGTYTPTLNNTTNITGSTAYVTGYYRVGNSVTVYGKIDIDATLAASTATELGVALPIASNLASEEDLGGTAISDSVASLTARIKGDATNDRASIVFKAISLTNDSYSFEFTYQVK